MLLNLGNLQMVAEQRSAWLKTKTARFAVVLAVGSVLVLLIAASTISLPPVRATPGEGLDDLEPLAIELFGRYSLAFEAASILLLASMVAVMVLAKRQRKGTSSERLEAGR
jgi:NADH:ubiquinone oxidoreductase subunit 6 (subunit J)